MAPKLLDAGWDSDPHSIAEQRSFTDGRIVVVGEKAHRRPRKRVDYLLRYTRDLPLAVVEAKASYRLPGDGLQQAKDYAEILGLKFAYSTNGHGIVEFDYTTGTESQIESFPPPDELWSRFRRSEKLTSDETAGRLLIPANLTTGKPPRYYQQIAIQRAVEAIAKGKRGVLLTMATGTGKTDVAFQISAGRSGHRAGTELASTASPAFSTSLTATFSSTIRKQRFLRLLATRGTKLGEKRS